MSFVDACVQDSLPIWQQCLESDFLRGLETGTLDEECFKGYIVDDSLYLREYARVFAWGMTKAKTMEEMRFYCSMLSFVNEREDATRLVYLRNWGLSDEAIQNLPQRPENQAYTEHMIRAICDDGVKYGWRAEGYEDLTDLYCKTRTQGFGSEVKRRILLGTFVLSSGYYDAYYKKALQVKALIKKAFDEAFAKYDLLLTPVAPTTAPKLGESLTDPLKMYLSDIYTVSVNLAGLPALSMPCGFDSKGIPIGAQLIGPALGDGAVLNAAHAFQLETDWHKKSPKGGDVQ